MRQRHYEEQRLFREYHRTRSPRDREAVIERFLPLARSLARRHRRGGEPLEDLEQVAFLALVKAVDGFDPARGYAFTSFAVPASPARSSGTSATTAGRCACRATSRAPMSVERANQERTTAPAAPTPAELAEHIGVDVEDVLEAREAYRALRADSLDQPRFSSVDDSEETLIDTLGTQDDEMGRALERVSLDALIHTLGERDQEIVRLYDERGATQTEIGERLGYSQMHISRLLRSAIQRPAGGDAARLAPLELEQREPPLGAADVLVGSSRPRVTRWQGTRIASGLAPSTRPRSRALAGVSRAS